MNPRFKTLHGKPTSLTDPYCECSKAAAARVLGKPEAELGWNDFKLLFSVGVAPATYEEGLWFLPAAFAFLRRNPSDALDCVADVLWFISEHAGRLERDGLLEDCRAQVQALLTERTEPFRIVHWDRAKNREMGWEREHYDFVEDSQLVGHTLEALLRFKTLERWAMEFVESLSRASNEPVKSAWFLECVRMASGWAFFRTRTDPPGTTRASEELCAAMPNLRGVWSEFQERGMVQDCPEQLAPAQAHLERHARVICNSGDLFTAHPTYWAKLFEKLGLAEAARAAQDQTARMARAGVEAESQKRRDQLIREIEAAFALVERGEGLTLHEAVAFEGTDHGTAEDRARARSRDPQTRWQDIPDSALEECRDRWCWEEAGFRFHLPAYLRWHLRHPQGLPPGWGAMLFLQLTLTGHKPKDRQRSREAFDRFTPDQKRAIARFLEFMALEAGQLGPAAGLTPQDAQIAGDAELAWRSYWFQFSESPTS